MQGLSFLGKRLRSSQHVDSVGFQHGSRVEASGRLRGGGGDGGSTGAESRSSYLEMYMEKKADQVRLPVLYRITNKVGAFRPPALGRSASNLCSAGRARAGQGRSHRHAMCPPTVMWWLCT